MVFIADTFHKKTQAYIIIVLGTGLGRDLIFIASSPNAIDGRQFLYNDGIWRSNGIGNAVNCSAYYDNENKAKQFANDCGCEIAGVVVI